MDENELVEWFKSLYIDWLTNLQRDAIAEGRIIPAEVIGRAFRELAAHYDILDDMPDIDDDFIERFFNEE